MYACVRAVWVVRERKCYLNGIPPKRDVSATHTHDTSTEEKRKIREYPEKERNRKKTHDGDKYPSHPVFIYKQGKFILYYDDDILQ